MNTWSKISRQAARQRQRGSRGKALALHQQLAANEEYRRIRPQAYLDDLIQGTVTARLNNEFELARSWEAEATGLLEEYPEEFYRYHRDAAQRLCKQAATLKPGPERQAMLAEAAERLEQSERLIRQQFDPHTARYHAELGATMATRGRLAVCRGRLHDAVEWLYRGLDELKLGHNPAYRLHHELDAVEVSVYLGDRLLATTLSHLLWSSWAHGTVWPKPLHFLRAGLHLTAMSLATNRRQDLLLRRGSLMRLLPLEAPQRH